MHHHIVSFRFSTFLSSFTGEYVLPACVDSEEGVRSSRIGVRDGCEPPSGY